MRSTLLRNGGSMAAGMLIGLSPVVAGFALTETTPALGQAMLVVGAPVVLALGIALQVFASPGPRGRG